MVLTNSVQERWSETEVCIDKAIGMIREMENLFYKQELGEVGCLNWQGKTWESMQIFCL